MASEEEPADFVSKKVSYMIQAIQGALPDVGMHLFGQMSTDVERFSFVWRLHSTQDVLALEPEYATKDKEKACKYREKGNEYFQRQSYLTALREYNKSLIAAPVQSSSENAAPESVSSAPSENAAEEKKDSEVAEQHKPAEEAAKKIDEAKEGAVAENATDSDQKPTADGDSKEETKKESDKNELALAYANRSAALFHLKRYKECLRDIELAIESNYPDSMRYKLFERQGACYKELYNPTEAKSSFQLALDSISAAGLSAKATNTLTTKLQKQIEACGKMPSRSTDKIDDVKGTKLQVPVVTGEQSKTHEGASAAVRILYDATLGRHAVAAKDIKVGDVLVSENPLVSVMLPGEFAGNHCYHCFALTDVPVPCRRCSSIIFCSRQCREEAWKLYHLFECTFGELLAPSTCAKIGHLAVRLVMSQGLDTLLTYLKTAAEPSSPEQAGFNGDGVYCNSYDSVYNLVTNSSRRKPGDLFEFSVIACVLVKIMKVSGYLGSVADSETDLELIGGAVLRYLQIIQCNALRVIELTRPNKFDEPNPVNVGVGIYPTAALINHSCDPNADLNFYNESVVVRAIRNIAEGEEIAISYGPVFYEVKQRMRHTQLKAVYFFNCRCEACQLNWPIAQEMFDDSPKYRCEKCRNPLATEEKFERKYFTCCVCKHKQDMEDLVGRLQLSYDLYAQAMNTAMNGSSALALPDFVQHLLLLQTYLRHPWRDLASCQSAVKHCYRLMANTRRSS